MTAFIWFFFLVLQWAYVVSPIVGDHLEELTNYDLESDLTAANVDAKKIGYTTVNVAGKEMAVNLWANKGQLPAAMCEAQTQTCDDVFVYIFPGKEEVGDDLRAEEIRSEELIASAAESYSPNTRCEKEQQELAAVKPIASFSEKYFDSLQTAFSVLSPDAVVTRCMMVFAFKVDWPYSRSVFHDTQTCTHKYPKQTSALAFNNFGSCISEPPHNRKLANIYNGIEPYLQYPAIREFVWWIFKTVWPQGHKDPVNLPRLVMITEFTFFGDCEIDSEMKILLCLICRWDTDQIGFDFMSSAYPSSTLSSFEWILQAAKHVANKNVNVRDAFLRKEGIISRNVVAWKSFCRDYRAGAVIAD